MSDGAGGYRAGARIGISLAVGTFLLAVTFGAQARQADWGAVAPVVASVAVFSGSAQFTLLTALAGAGAAWAAVASACLINLRFLPMSLAVAPWLRGGRLRKAVEAQTVVDASFVVAHVGGDRFDRERLIGATAPQWLAWIAGTAVGVLAAPPERVEYAFALDVVFPIFFVVLLLDELATAPNAWRAGLLGGVLTAVLLLALPPGLALLGGASAALLGLRDRQEGR
jgi:predicted branched-subunit amino acid permease